MKGVILAAGQGTRMSSITYNGFPKELLPIGNVPTIRFPIEAFKLAGINKIMTVIAPHTKHAIIDGLQSGKRFNVRICYVVQEKNENGITGIGQAILTTKNWIEDDEHFLVACGDTILCNFSLKDPLDCLNSLKLIHQSLDAMATILVHPIREDPRRFGVVRFSDFINQNGILYGGLKSMVEKPTLEVAKNYKMNGFYYTISGYYAFSPKIFKYIEQTKPGVKNEIQITDSISLALENGEKVFAVIHGQKLNDKVIPYSYWDVGVPKDYKDANIQLLQTEIDKLISW